MAKRTIRAGVLAVIERGYTGRRLVFARIDRDGSVLEEWAVNAGSVSGLRWAGGRFYGVESTSSRIGLFVAEDGQPPRIIEILGIELDGRAHDAAWNGDGYAVLWTEGTESAEHELRFAQVSADGALLEASIRALIQVPAGSGARLIGSEGGHTIVAGSGAELLEIDPEGLILSRRRLSDAPEPRRISELVRLAGGVLVHAYSDGAARGVRIVTDAAVEDRELGSGISTYGWFPASVAT